MYAFINLGGSYLDINEIHCLQLGYSSNVKKHGIVIRIRVRFIVIRFLVWMKIRLRFLVWMKIRLKVSP